MKAVLWLSKEVDLFKQKIVIIVWHIPSAVVSKFSYTQKNFLAILIEASPDHSSSHYWWGRTVLSHFHFAINALSNFLIPPESPPSDNPSWFVPSSAQDFLALILIEASPDHSSSHYWWGRTVLSHFHFAINALSNFLIPPESPPSDNPSWFVPSSAQDFLALILIEASPDHSTSHYWWGRTVLSCWLRPC